MNTSQKNSQASQSGDSSRQPGQTDMQAGQSSQDNRYGDSGQRTGVQQGQGEQVKGQGREVSAAATQGGQVSRAQTTTLLPPVDIYEDESGFTLMADMPGVAKDQLLVRVTGDNLLIEGTATVPAAGNMELVYGEVQTPQYRRSFTLSRELDPGKIEARLDNGVLRLRIPKAEEAKPRRIEINVG